MWRTRNIVPALMLLGLLISSKTQAKGASDLPPLGHWYGLILADSPKAQSKDPAAIDAVKQVEQGMGKAIVAGDIDKLSQIYADDFTTIGSSGKVITKETLLSDFKSFHDKLEWFENGPIVL